MTTYDIQYRPAYGDGFRHLHKAFATVSEATHYLAMEINGRKQYRDASIVAIVDGQYRPQPTCGERELIGAELAEHQAWHNGGYSGAIDMAPFVADSAKEAARHEGYRKGTIPIPTAR